MKNMVKALEIKTKYGTYGVRVEPDEKGLIATATTLPGVITWAKNFSQLKKYAKEAIELCVE